MNNLIIKPFLFKDEVDILEIQFEELYDVVDYFIIVETERSFQGRVREDFGHFERNRERFSKYLDKVIHYKLEKDSYPENFETVSSIERRNFSYELLKSAVASMQLPDTTIVLFGDCDEIPKKESILNIKNGIIPIGKNTILNLEMNLFYFYFNYICNTIKWKGFKVCSLPIFLNNLVYDIRCAHDYTNITTIPNCGWHYSYFGDVNFVINKLNTTCDGTSLRNDEKIMNPSNIEDAMKSGRDIYFRSEYSWSILPIEGLELPEAVKVNPDKYSKFFNVSF